MYRDREQITGPQGLGVGKRVHLQRETGREFGEVMELIVVMVTCICTC